MHTDKEEADTRIIGVKDPKAPNTEWTITCHTNKDKKAYV